MFVPALASLASWVLYVEFVPMFLPHVVWIFTFLFNVLEIDWATPALAERYLYRGKGILGSF